jgi:hypothetical protein
MAERASGLMGRGNVDESSGDPGNSLLYCCFNDGCFRYGSFYDRFVILWGDEIVSVG